MPTTFTQQEPTLLADLMSEVEAKSSLVDRLARHDKLLASHATSAGEFVEALYPDEVVYFLTSTPVQLYPALRRWLRFWQENPGASYYQSGLQLAHAWSRRYNAAQTDPRNALPPRELFTLRLRVTSLLHEGRVHWVDFDAPYADLDRFMRWLPDSDIEWVMALGNESFLAAVRSWIDYFHLVFIQAREPRWSSIFYPLTSGNAEAIYRRSAFYLID